MQRAILVCHQPLYHRGDHTTYTDGGTLASWTDVGRLRFSPRHRTDRATAGLTQALDTPAVSPPRLRDRQAEVLTALLAGRTAESIAEAMGVTEGTVGAYIREMRARFGVRSESAMIAAARQLGFKPA
jgi:DNA-binding NarL/FixJ family response regulator